MTSHCWCFVILKTVKEIIFKMLMEIYCWIFINKSLRSPLVWCYFWMSFIRCRTVSFRRFSFTVIKNVLTKEYSVTLIKHEFENLKKWVHFKSLYLLMTWKFEKMIKMFYKMSLCIELLILNIKLYRRVFCIAILRVNNFRKNVYRKSSNKRPP